MQSSISSIVNDSHNKYIFRDIDKVNLDNCRLDNNSIIVVNVGSCELPYVEDDKIYDERIQYFHLAYYNILFTISIIDELINRYDKDFLNQKLNKVFKHYSRNNCIIKDIDVFRELLVHSRDTYYNECSNYANGLQCGSLLHLAILSIHMNRFICVIKDCLEFDGYFSLIININSKMSRLSLETLEKYMLSKHNMGLSINIFCNDIELNDNIMTRVKVVN